MRFEIVKIHKHCLYCNVFSTEIYRKIVFNGLLLLNLFLLISKLYELRLKIPQIFPDMLGNWDKNYILGLLLLSFMKSSIPTFKYFLSFFHLVCKLFKSRFKFLYVSINCTSRVFDFVTEALNYIWDLLVLLFMENSVFMYSDFFLVCKLYKSGLEIMLLISEAKMG